jgi:hypothetical protein
VNPDIPIVNSALAILASLQKLIDHMQPPLSGAGRPRVALYLTIAEQFDAALTLAKVGAGTHSAVHVRSMLEALIAMNLLGIDSGYVNQMRFEKLRGEKKLYEGLLSNTGLTEQQRKPLTTKLVTCKAQYEELHAKGLRPKRIADDLTRAGLGDYAAPYAMLCGFSHNDVAILALRHQGDDGMQYRAPVDQHILQSIFSIAMSIMITATQPLSEIALFPDGHFESVFQDMNNTWGEFLRDAGV